MVVLNTITEALAFIDSFDGYGMVATDEQQQVQRLRQLDLVDDYREVQDGRDV
jgi:hypothetical protein